MEKVAVFEVVLIMILPPLGVLFKEKKYFANLIGRSVINVLICLSLMTDKMEYILQTSATKHL